MSSAADGDMRSETTRAPIGFVIVCEGVGGLVVEQYWASLRPDQRLEAAMLLTQAADRVKIS